MSMITAGSHVSAPINHHLTPEPASADSPSRQPSSNISVGPEDLRNTRSDSAQAHSWKKDLRVLCSDIVRNNDWRQGLSAFDDNEFRYQLNAKGVALNDDLIVDQALIRINALHIPHEPDQDHTQTSQIIENTRQNLQHLRAIALNTPQYINELQNKGVVCAESFYERSCSVISNAKQSIVSHETQLPLSPYQKRLAHAIDHSLICLQRLHQVTPSWKRYLMAAGALAAITPVPLAVSFVAGEKNLQVMTIGRTFTTAFLAYNVACRPTTDAKSIRSFMFKRGFVVNLTNCLFLPKTLIPYIAQKYPLTFGITAKAADSFAKKMHSLGLKYSAPASLVTAAAMILLEFKCPQRVYDSIKMKLRT